MAFNRENNLSNPNTGALFCFDFDETISSKHVHNSIMRAHLSRGTDDQQWEVIKNIKPRGSASEWKALFEKLITDGHQVAILSYSQFPRIIDRYLKEIIGLEKEILDQIFVNSWLPDDQNSGKNKHIRQAIDYFHRDTTDKNIVLVEDSIENLKMAKQGLHKDGAILAPKNASDSDPNDSKLYLTAPHIAEVARLSEQLKNEIAVAAKANVASQDPKKFYGAESGMTTFDNSVDTDDVLKNAADNKSTFTITKTS